MKGKRAGRNEPCPCGSGRKYKRCCLEKDRKRQRSRMSINLRRNYGI